MLSGPYGCGKTHLAASIANYRAGLGDPPLFIEVPDLLDHLRSTFSPASPIRYDRLFDEIRAANLLVLDDLGAQSASPWAKEKLYQLMNHRYNAELPTVITIARESLEQHYIDERILTRMLDKAICNFLEITAPSYRGTRKRTAKAKSRDSGK